MTAKEKADELVRRMNQSMMPHGMDKTDSKLCALIAVDETISHINTINNDLQQSLMAHRVSVKVDYWQQVKENINKL